MEKVLELAEKFGYEPVPGEKVCAFVASVFMTSLPELSEEEHSDDEAVAKEPSTEDQDEQGETRRGPPS